MTQKINQLNLITIVSASALFLVLLVVSPIFAQGRDSAPGQQRQAERSTGEPPSGRTPDNQQRGPKKNTFVGSVEQVEQDSIEVEETTRKNRGNRQNFKIGQDTRIVGNNRQAMRLDAIKVKDVVALVGNSEQETATQGASFRVERVFVQEASESAQMKRRAIQGVITQIEGNVLTVAHQIHRDRTHRVTVSENTFIRSPQGDTLPEDEDSDEENDTSQQLPEDETVLSATTSLAVGQRIAAVGDLDPEGGIAAKMIHVIPGRATGIFERDSDSGEEIKEDEPATESATPTDIISPTETATESAFPSPTPEENEEDLL